MTMPVLICKPLLEVNVQIETDTNSSFEHTLWLEGHRGGRLEGVCSWCSRMFPLTLAEVQSNATVRCWHCGASAESLEFLDGAHPGLTALLVAPAIDALLNDFQNRLKKALG